MEDMNVESNKTFIHGFLLKEQDLRRFNTLISDQLNKISNNPISHSYLMKFANGTVASTNNIEDVLNQENDGFGLIKKLQIKSKLINDNKLSEIRVDFEEIEDDYSYNQIPIKYSIKSQSRDWVFVTSSLIEERIAKIKNNKFNLNFGYAKTIKRYVSPLIVMLFISTAMISQALTDVYTRHFEAIENVEKKWKNHKITDPVAVIIQLEKSRALAQSEKDGAAFFKSFFSIGKIFIIVFLLAIVPLVYYLSKNSSPFNFYWGNYMEVYDKKDRNRKIIIGVVISTIILGVVVNLISNLIWEYFTKKG